MKTKRKLWGWVFVAPQILGLLIFALVPLFMSFGLSFFEWDGIAPKMNFVGISNYLKQLANEDFLISLKNTLIYSVMYIPVDMVLALMLALAVQKIKGKTLYRLLYFMPVVTGSVSVGIIWTWIFNKDFGLINNALKAVGIDGPGWLSDPEIVMLSIVIVSLWWNVGYNMVLLLAGLQNIPETYFEAAKLDGASKSQLFFNITLPMLSPTLFFVLITTIISSFQVFDQAFVMTGGGPIKSSYTLVFHIYQNAFVHFRMGIACAASMAGYSFAKLKFTGHNLVFILFLATMMIPSQVTMIPLFVIMKKLHLLGSHMSLILPASLFNAFGVFLMRQFIASLPGDLEEAAIIDGCSVPQIFIHVILPLIKPSMAAFGIFVFLGQWNNFLYPLIFLNKTETFTVPLMLNFFKGTYATDYPLLMSGTVISIIPVLIVYVIFQRQIIQGIAITGMKS
ncbi:ABC transporter permease [Butyrivibrio sp. WCD3002]|uniref:ABC transporter permease n=1 Tax=Butyrivibrio sp. WCD3002 TaxID=1280676 RepID=UPI000424A5A5|nr:ABC transporter permease subunit [Butyrivibrio sp. WCD3002]